MDQLAQLPERIRAATFSDEGRRRPAKELKGLAKVDLSAFPPNEFSQVQHVIS